MIVKVNSVDMLLFYFIRHNVFVALGLLGLGGTGGFSAD